MKRIIKLLFWCMLISLLCTCHNKRTKFNIEHIKDDFGVRVMEEKLVYNELEAGDSTFLEAWTFIHENQLGLHGRRPLNAGAFLGIIPAKKKYFKALALNNWFPLLPQKVTVCGKFDHFNTHHSTASGEEKDWNIFVQPNEEFSFITKLAEQYKDLNVFRLDNNGGAWKKSKSGKYLIEGEITPFSNSNNESILGFPIKNHERAQINELLGTTICLYGPGVREYVHNNRPEIHPSEIIWWRKDSTLKFIALQDASNRFNEEKHYSLDNKFNFADLWHTWSENTSQFEILLPFDFSMNTNEQLVFKFFEEEKRKLQIPDTLGLNIDNKIYVKVLKYMPNNPYFKFKFVDVYKSPTSNIVKGFIKINFTLGFSSPIKESLVGLKVESNYFNPSIYQSDILLDRYVIQTMEVYPKKKDGDLKLFADYALQYEEKPLGLSFEDTDSNLDIIQKNKSIRTSILRSIPINTKKVQFEFPDVVLDTTLPDFDLQIFPLSEIKKKFRRSGNRTTEQFKAFTKTQKTNLKACALKKAEIEVKPFYVYCIENDCNIEDEADEIAQLNAWAIREIEAETNSFKYDWTFKLIILDSEKVLPDSNYIHIKESIIQPDSHRITITFKEQDRYIFKLLAVVSISDTFGLRGTDTLILYSHELNLENNGVNIAFQNAEDFLEEIATAFDIDYESIKIRMEERRKGQFPVFFPKTSIPNLKEMKYQAVINYFHQIIGDNHVNHSELEGLVKSINNIESKFSNPKIKK